MKAVSGVAMLSADRLYLVEVLEAGLLMILIRQVVLAILAAAAALAREPLVVDQH
jgi:hypothetical protein